MQQTTMNVYAFIVVCCRFAVCGKELGAGKVCVLCGHGQESDAEGGVVYGKLHSKAGITAHYFCLLFSSGLCQNGGSEREGILGFLPADIAKEVSRGFRLRCSYCKSKGATIGCVTKQCKANFHLGCGRAKSSFHQFFGSFSSYCSEHRPQQDVPAETDPSTVCSICTNTVNAAPCNESLRAPCCSKYWYHRKCIQQYAMSAGLYFFKCPMCKNKEDFQQELLSFGIYIPEQDAAWETEPNAYQELLERYQNCDAQDCKCVEGRKYDKEGSKWEIFLCATCGSQGSHEACKYLTKHKGKYACPDCVKFVKINLRKVKSPERSTCQELVKGTDSSLEYTKQSTSEYPGPSHTIQKKSVPSKFNSVSDPQMSQSSKSEKGKKSVVVGSKNTEKLTGIKNKKKDCRATFMDRYLNKSLSSSPSSSSSAESAAEDSILMSYLNNNQLMSAYDLKEAKKYQKKAIKNMQRNKSDKMCPDNKQECKKKMDLTHNSSLSSESVHNEKDKKLQKTLHSWFKGPITPKKNNHHEEQAMDYRLKTALAKSPRKRNKKPYVMESHGQQYVIRSPKVHLGKKIKLPDRTLKLNNFNKRKNNLVIDMVDDCVNPGWENELAILSSIDTEVRVTRNMVSSNRLENFIPIMSTTSKRKKNRKSMADERNKMDLNSADLYSDSDTGSFTKTMRENRSTKMSHKSSSMQLGQLVELLEPKSFDKTESGSSIVPTCSCNSRITNQESTYISENCPICTDKLSETNEGLKEVSSSSCLTVLEVCNTDGMKARYINEQSPSLKNTEKNMFTFNLSGIGSLSKDLDNAEINHALNMDQDSTVKNKYSVKSPKSQTLTNSALSDNSVWAGQVCNCAGVNITNVGKMNGFINKYDKFQGCQKHQADNESIVLSSPCKKRKLIVETQSDCSPKDVNKSPKVDSLSKNKRSANDEKANMIHESYRTHDKGLSTCSRIGTPPQKVKRNISTDTNGTLEKRLTVETVASTGSNMEKLTNYKFEFDKQKASLKKRNTFLNQESTPTRSNAKGATQIEGSPNVTEKSVPVDSPSRCTRNQTSQVQNCDKSRSLLSLTSLANPLPTDEGITCETLSHIQLTGKGTSQKVGSPKVTDRLTPLDSPSRHTRNSPLRSQNSVGARKNIPVLLDINQDKLNSNNEDIMKTQNRSVKKRQEDGNDGYCEKMGGEMENNEQIQSINEKPTTAVLNENIEPLVSSIDVTKVFTKDVEGKESTPAVNNSVLSGPKNTLPPPNPFSSDRSAMSAYYVKEEGQ